MGYGIRATSLKPSRKVLRPPSRRLSKFSKVDDLLSLAPHCLCNDYEETGNIEDAATLSKATGLIGTEYATHYELDKDETRRRRPTGNGRR